MFKLESYVAPLLIGYIDKYVKLNKDDFQMSLWGGDVVLNKLELRLDVIETLIKVPISLRSGWIHELRVHVPWTHLYSDPVIITINTIECSVKLRYSDKNVSSNLYHGMSSSNIKNTDCMTKIESPEDLPLPGYLQSLLNKIVNNINIIVNNLILKFVDEDIVLSLNIKSAECYSTDLEWSRSFVELIPEDLTVRRVLNIYDLTLCLDKRNASGKIENYQAPILYKCMLTLRMALIYESLFSKLPWMTKVNVVCDSLNVSVTDVQLPMFQKLIGLFVHFYYGSSNIHQDYLQEVKEDADDVQADEGITGFDNQGWVSWIWSYVPPIFSYTQESDWDGFKDKKKDDVFIIGFHVGHMLVHLKHSIISQVKGQLGFQKMIFMPYILANFNKLNFDVRLKGHSFVDVQFGISNMKSYYHCNCLDYLPDGEVCDTMNIQFFMSGENTDSHGTNNYFHKSLFDDDYEIESFPNLEDEHILMFTEDYARKNYSFFWMNIFNTMETHEDSIRVDSSHISVLDLKEKSLFRVFVGKSELIFSSRLFEIVKELIFPLLDSISTSECDTEETRQFQSEDLSRIELNAVTCRYFVSLLQPSIYFYPFNTIPRHHKCFETNESNKSSGINSSKSKKAGIPVIIAACGRLDLNFSMPHYPKLLSRTCSIQSTLSEQAWKNCHSFLFIQVNKFNIYLQLMDYREHEKRSAIHLESFQLHKKSLLFCNFWNDLFQPEKDWLLEGDNLTLNLTKPQFLIINFIFGSWIFASADNTFCSLSLLNDAFCGKDSLASLSLEITIPSLEIHYLETKAAHAISGCITTALILMIGFENGKQFLLPLLYGPLDLSNINSGKEFLSEPLRSFNKEITGDLVSFSCQIKKSSVFNSIFEGIFIKILGISFLIDPIFYKWVSYIPKHELEQNSWLNNGIALDTDPLKSSFFGSESSGSYCMDQSFLASNSFNSHNTNKFIDVTNYWHDQLSIIYHLLKFLEVEVNIENCCFFLSSQCIYPTSPVVDIPAMIHSLFISKNVPDILVIVSPAISVTSCGTLCQSLIPPIPIRADRLSIEEEKFPWKLILKGMSGYSLHGCKIVIEFLESITMSLTMALNVNCKESNYKQDINVSLCLHCDIDVAHISLSSEQIVLVAALLEKLWKTVKDSLKTVHYMKEMLNVSKNNLQSTNLTNDLPEPSLGSSNFMSFSNNLDAVNISEIMSDDLSLDFRDEQNSNEDRMSLWLQLTISKLLIEFNLLDIIITHRNSMLLCEIADLTNSLDIHETYINLKSKVNSISIKMLFQHQEIPIVMSVVHLPQHLTHILTSKNSRTNVSHFQNSCLTASASTNAEFLTFVFTRIYDLKSIDRFVNKYENKKSQSLTFGISHCLDEICLVLQPLVILLDFESILTLIKLLEMINALLYNGSNKSSETMMKPDGLTFVFTELPLIHLNMRAVYIFAKECNSASSSNQTSEIDERLEDTIVIYIQSFNIVPYADNPLPRLVVDKNLYIKAVQLGMLGFMPGHQLEDRQYQTLIHGITFASICWENVFKQSCLKSDSLISGNIQNPAFEWNSDLRSNEIFHIGLLMPCTDIQIIFAPAIISHEKLVCGYSTEVNATSEIEICLTSSQIRLLVGLISAVTDFSHYCQSYSKITLEEASPYKLENISSNKPPTVPFDLLVTGIRLNVLTFMNETSSFDNCNDSKKCILKPILCFLIYQPHILLKYDEINLKSRFEISCYDGCIKSGNPMSSHSFDPRIESIIFNSCPNYSDFPHFLMETKQGKVHTITGVLSSLCTCTIFDFHSNKVKTDIKIERPIQFSYYEDHTEMFLIFFDKLLEYLHVYGYKLKNGHTSKDIGKISRLQNFVWMENVSLDTIQCVFQWFVKVGESQKTLKFSTKNINLCVNVQSDNKLSCKIRITNLAFTLLPNDAMFFIFGPTTIEGVLTLSSYSIYLVHENPLVIPSIEVFLHCDMIILQFTKESLTCLNAILHNLLFLDSEERSLFSSDKKETDIICLNFENDLKSDGFSFIQNEENGLPVSGEIMFQADAKHSSMTWKYHEPRAINNLMVIPKPFQIGEEFIPDYAQKFKGICCILQYSLDNGLRFNDYSSFEVGKNVLIEVPLPTIKDCNFVVACLWRALLKKDFSDNYSRVFQNIAVDNFIERSEVLSPLVLASCLKINTSIIPQLIHTVTINASFDKIEAIFKYSGRNLRKKSVVKNCNVLPDHRMAILNCMDSSICFQTLLSDFSRSRLNIVSKLECNILEYTSLTWLKIIQETVITLNVSFDKKVSKLEMASIINICHMTISQEIVHSLDLLYNFWKESSDVPYIVSRYLILNNTQEEIYFGQIGTEKTLCLQPRSSYQYFWDNRLRKKQLWWGINKHCPDDSNILSMEKIGLAKIIKLLDGRILSVRSDDYFKIQIGGNLTFGSNLDFDAFIKIELGGSSIIKELNAMELLPSFVVKEKELENIRMRISCDDLNTWSEEVILGHAPRKYLLKICASGKYINVWCEILIQNKNDTNMCLVLFTPIFILKSHYPNRLIMNVSQNKSSDDLHITVKGKGRTTSFHCLYSLPLDITFQLHPELSASNPVLSISSNMVTNTIENNCNANLDIDHIINDWKNDDCMNHWPYNAIDVSVLSSTQVRSLNDSDNYADFNIPTPNIELNISLGNYTNYSNTVLVELTPQWMIINETNLDLIITNLECSEMWRFSQSKVLVPPIMEKFVVMLLIKGRSYNSSVIKLLSNELSGLYQPNVDICLTMDSHAILLISITDNNKIIQQIHMTIHSRWKFNMRIITIKERFVFVNNIPYNVLLHSCIYSSNQVEIDKSTLPTVCIDKSLNKVEVVQPLLLWNFCENGESSSHAKFWLYMKLSETKTNGMYWSSPVYLEVASETSCHHVIVYASKAEEHVVKSIPCCLTVQFMNGLIYLVLDFESCAFMRVHNNCNFSVYLAVPQCSKVVSRKIYTKVVAIEAHSSEYFCPLLSTKSITFFPFVVVIGCHDHIFSNIVWSQPLEVHENLNSVIKLGDNNFKIKLEIQGLVPHMKVNPAVRANIITVEKFIHNESVHQLHSNHNPNVFLPPKHIACYDHKNESFWFGFKINIAIVCRNMLCLFKDDMSEKFSLQEISDNHFKIIFLVAMDDVFISLNSVFGEKLSNSIYKFELSIGDFQLDNKAFDDGTFDFPVVILRSQEGYSYKKLQNKVILNDIFKYKFENVFLKVVGTFVLEPKFHVLELTFTFSPIAICLEDTFFYKVMEFVYSFNHILKFQRAKSNIYSVVPLDVKLISNDFANTLRLQKLTIEPITVLISFHASLKIFLALDSTPMSFGKFEKENMWLTKQQLSKLLTLHYASGALLRTGVVIGSLEILGNPTGFVRSISNGIYDMIYLPYNGLTLGPASCITGFSNGIKSIVKHVSTGTLTSISNFASGISRNMERLSMDKDHINIFEKMRRRKPQGLTQGFFDGLTGFGLSLLGAIAGLADQPLQACIASGNNKLSAPAKARGIISGFGKGLIGMLAKPIGGAAELVSMTSIGFMQGAGLMKVYQQKDWQICHSNEFQSNLFDQFILTRNDLKYEGEELLFCLDNCSLNFSMECLIILTWSVIYIWNCSDNLLMCSYPITDVHLSVDHKSSELLFFVSSNQDEEDDLLLKSDNKWIMDYISKNYLLQTHNFGASSPAKHGFCHSTKLKLKYIFNFCDKHKADTLLCLIDYALCSKDVNNFI